MPSESVLIRFFNPRSVRRAAIFHIGLAFVLTLLGTHFRSSEEILAVHSWGGGTPSSSVSVALATGRAWWKRTTPEAVRITPTGGIEPVVVLPRAEIGSTEERVIPERGVGYDAFVGSVIAVRSLFSSSLTIDFRLIVVLQRLFLAASVALLPLALYAAHESFRRARTFPLFNLAHVVLLLVRPNKNKFLSEGILDSALANGCALLSVAAFLTIVAHSRLESRKSVFVVLAAGLFLSFCPLIRGEFLVVFLFVLAVLFVLSLISDSVGKKGVALAFLAMWLFPVGYGLVNKGVFGHFVPLRIRSGQNLYEPIGQYPNPWGIQYSDAWLAEYLESKGVGYTSFEADAFLTKRYFELLRENPGLFLRNFHARLWEFAKQFSYLLNPWTLPFLLGLVLYRFGRDPRFVAVAVPLVAAVGYLLFFGWTNSLLRLVSPVHFLFSAFLAFLLLYAATLWLPSSEPRS